MSDYNLGEAHGKITLDADLSGVTTAAAGLNTFKGNAEKASVSAKNMVPALSAVSTAATIAGAAIVAGFGLAVKVAADFEFQMSAVQAVSGATAEEMDLISEAALRIGKDTSFSASEAGLAIEELVKAGISVTDVLNGAADATVALAAAGGVDLPTAATIAANAMNQFGLAAEDLVHVTDQIAGVANASAIDMEQFAYSMSQVGAVAKLAGLSFDDTALAIAAMGNAGIVGSDAGTSLKQVLLNLNPVTDKQRDLMKQLGIVTEDGSNAFYDQEGRLKSLADISQVLQDSLSGMTDQQKQMTLETLFGSDAIRGAAILAKEGAAGFDELAASVSKVSAADVAAQRLNNLNGQIEQLKGSIETIAIRIGDSLMPVIKDLAKFANDLAGKFIEMDDKTVRLIASIGLAVGAGLLLFGIFGKVAQTTILMRDALLLASGANTIFATTTNGVSLAQKAAAAATLLFNAALNANPILKVVTLVLALVAALITLAGGWDEVAAAFKPIAENIIEGLKPLLPMVSQIAQMFSGLLMNAIAQLAPVVMSLLQALFPLVDTVFAALVPLLQIVAEILVAVLAPVLGIVGALFQALVPIITLLLGLLTPLIELLVSLLVPVLNLVVIALQWLADGLAFVIEWMKQWVEDAIPVVIQFMLELWQNIQTVWQGIMAAIRPVVDWFMTYVVPLIQAVVNLIVALWNWAWNNLVTVFTALQNFVTTVWGGIASFISGIVTGVVNFIQAAWGNLWNLVQSIFGKVVKDGVQTPLEGILGFFEDMKNNIIGFFANAGKWLLDAGANIIGGLIAGIQGALGGLTDLLNGITGMIPQEKGPPAKDKVLLKPAGALIMKGLISGIQSEIGNLEGMLGGLNVSIPAMMMGGIGGGSSSTDNRKFIYNAAPGSPQIDGEQEYFTAIRRSKVVVPGWAG